jgi:beta-lactam-binding protein with PASTA domain
LIDLSVRQALGTLETVGLQLGNVRYTPAFDKNSILKQYHNGIEIKAGDMITKGAVIDLEAGAGLDKPETELPFLYGKSPREVQLILIYSSLNIGEEQFYGSQNKDSVLAYSYQPEWYNSRIVDYGTTVNISYCSPDNYNFDSLIFIKMFGDEYYYKFFDKSKHYSKSFFDSIFKDPQIYYSIIKNDIYTE